MISPIFPGSCWVRTGHSFLRSSAPEDIQSHSAARRHRNETARAPPRPGAWTPCAAAPAAAAQWTWRDMPCFSAYTSRQTASTYPTWLPPHHHAVSPWQQNFFSAAAAALVAQHSPRHAHPCAQPQAAFSYMGVVVAVCIHSSQVSNKWRGQSRCTTIQAATMPPCRGKQALHAGPGGRVRGHAVNQSSR